MSIFDDIEKEPITTDKLTGIGYAWVWRNRDADDIIEDDDRPGIEPRHSYYIFVEFAKIIDIETTAYISNLSNFYAKQIIYDPETHIIYDVSTPTKYFKVNNWPEFVMAHENILKS